jgi:hypothetical protein
LIFSTLSGSEQRKRIAIQSLLYRSMCHRFSPQDSIAWIFGRFPSYGTSSLATSDVGRKTGIFGLYVSLSPHARLKFNANLGLTTYLLLRSKQKFTRHVEWHRSIIIIVFVLRFDGSEPILSSRKEPDISQVSCFTSVVEKVFEGFLHLFIHSLDIIRQRS